MTAKTYDLCVIGAGVAGGLIAAEAVRQGRSVALLEAGRRFAFDQRQAQLHRRRTIGGPTWPWFHEGRDKFVDSSKESIGFEYDLARHRVKAVGGTTLHWGGKVSRFMVSDFRTQSTYGHGVDWPLEYGDLEEFYGLAEQQLGVAGTPHAASPPRSSAFPMTGFPASADEQIWYPIAARLGVPLYLSAFAINSAPYDGRSKCLAFASCDVCPSGARYSADFHVARAETSGLCDLHAETVARRIEVNRNGEVQAVHATTLAGADVEVHARQYVVAAHAIESARLLLLSNLGNQSDQVGRNLMEHLYVGAGGLLPHQRFKPYQVGFERLETLHYYEGERRRQRGAIKLEFSFEKDPLADMSKRGLWGAALARHEAKVFGHWVGIEAETEHQPNPDSRVRLDERERDMFGDPVPHVRLAFSDTDRETQADGRAAATQLLTAAGAESIEPMEMTFASHQLGTCRMADDAAKGVVDRNCRVHGTSNLYAVGSSVFPTGGAVQPTLTIAALSLRLARHLMARLQSA